MFSVIKRVIKIDGYFNFANDQFDIIRTDIKKDVGVTVADSFLLVKDSIIEALEADNRELQQKVEKLENKISELESDITKEDQYNRRNSTKIQGIPSGIDDDSLEEKIIEMLCEADVAAKKSDTEDCHRPSKNGITIIRFFIRKFCNVIWEKKILNYTKTLTSQNLVLIITLRFMLVKI